MSSRILTDLPFEIFWLIVKSLDSCERDINALAQVNRDLYALLNPYLYRLNVHNPSNPAIAWGAYHGQEATVRKALEQGAWTRSTFGAGKSPEPITLAALAGHANIVKLLLNHGVQPMKRWDWNDNGTRRTDVMDWDYTGLGPIRDWPPWTAALVRDRAEVLQVLIDDAGFVSRFFDFFKLLPNGDGYFDTIEGFETFKVLVRGCPKWEYHVEHQYAGILSLAIHDSIGNLEVMRFLVDSECPVNYPDLWGHTPLAYAADAGNVETVEFLLDRGADPDPGIPWPLRLAAEKGHVKVAELLLERIDVRRKITSGDDLGYFTRRRPVGLRRLCELAWMPDATQIEGCTFAILLSHVWMINHPGIHGWVLFDAARLGPFKRPLCRRASSRER
ncbi:hypothetical protein N7519_006930 [Penicillium mononematosum]|uniref:uncharacterized protein n=1 Tax=Penicillium mononematosum TaxID=268346 RepID=UPI002546E895|nr:uncharacterized protein N7519_006930 [Penicillium mononematosum]KAJ6185629.1 hypothetical protein N7519_006930 [Penicillium mononematosum]